MNLLPALSALAIAMGGPSLAAQAADTLSLSQAQEEARRANSGLQAARLNADAAAARVGPAGALPDPQLSFAFMNRPINDFGTDQPMTMNAIQYSQRFPWPGTLGFARERARFLANATRLDADDAELMLAARVASVYYEIGYLDRAVQVMEETRDLLRDFHHISSAMYAVGRGVQQDVLQAQVAIAQMDEDITVMQQQRIAMTARLNALMGRAATRPIPAVALPTPDAMLADADSLVARATRRRPALRAAHERVEAAQAGYRAARRAVYPDFNVTLGYGQRPQFEDFATLMVGVSVPLWMGARQLPLREEARAMRYAEEARERDLYNETFARLVELRAEAERAQSLATLYATAVLPQAHAAVESALSAYRVGQVDFTTLVRSELTVNQYEIESLRLAAQFHRAVAAIEALVGDSLEMQP